MTIVQISIPAVDSQATIEFVEVDVTAAAQAAGDQAYALVQAAGLSPEECADAYHVAAVEMAFDLGRPIPCACAFCATLSAH